MVSSITRLVPTIQPVWLNITILSQTLHGTAIYAVGLHWGGASGVNGAAVLWQSHVFVSGYDRTESFVFLWVSGLFFWPPTRFEGVESGEGTESSALERDSDGRRGQTWVDLVYVPNRTQGGPFWEVSLF